MIISHASKVVKKQCTHTVLMGYKLIPYILEYSLTTYIKMQNMPQEIHFYSLILCKNKKTKKLYFIKIYVY